MYGFKLLSTPTPFRFEAVAHIINSTSPYRATVEKCRVVRAGQPINCLFVSTHDGVVLLERERLAVSRGGHDTYRGHTDALEWANQQLNYFRAPYNHDLRALSRFWQKVELDTVSGCWIWVRGLTNGYGGMQNGKGVSNLAHRFAYHAFVGSVPEGLELDHLCRVRCCVNPWHLEPVTRSENMRRGDSGIYLATKESSKTHCPWGHPYDEENTKVYRGKRICIICLKSWRRKSDSKRKGQRRGCNRRKVECS